VETCNQRGDQVNQEEYIRELTNLRKIHEAIAVKLCTGLRKMLVKGGKYKTGLVVKGYKQKRGVDCDEVYATVARMDTIHIC